MTKRTQRRKRFAICITDSEPDLQLRRVYKVLPDASAARTDYLRVIDDTGEDYLYPASYFVFVEVPKKAEAAFSAVASSS